MDQQQEIATLRADLAALRREMRKNRRGLWARVLGVALVTMLALVPAALGAHDRFSDVPFDAFYHNDATALADAGITFGCGGGRYCPNDVVTRGQMASFLARTAGIGGNPPVTNAATLGGWPAHALVRSSGAGSGSSVFILSGSYGTATAATVDVPASGFVLVSGAVRLTSASSSVGRVCVRLVDPVLALQSLEQCMIIGTVGGSVIEGELVAIVRFPVSGSGFRTFHLQVAKDTSVSVGTTFADNAVVNSLYVPFGAGGAQAASTTAQTADDGAELIPMRDLPPAESLPSQQP